MSIDLPLNTESCYYHVIGYQRPTWDPVTTMTEHKGEVVSFKTNFTLKDLSYMPESRINV